MKLHRLLILVYLVMGAFSGTVPAPLFAAEEARASTPATQETEVFEPEATKLVLVDATPLDPIP